MSSPTKINRPKLAEQIDDMIDDAHFGSYCATTRAIGKFKDCQGRKWQMQLVATRVPGDMLHAKVSALSVIQAKLDALHELIEALEPGPQPAPTPQRTDAGGVGRDLAECISDATSMPMHDCADLAEQLRRRGWIRDRPPIVAAETILTLLIECVEREPGGTHASYARHIAAELSARGFTAQPAPVAPAAIPALTEAAYECRCCLCDSRFIGDKRAVVCPGCMLVKQRHPGPHPAPTPQRTDVVGVMCDHFHDIADPEHGGTGKCLKCGVDIMYDGTSQTFDEVTLIPAVDEGMRDGIAAILRHSAICHGMPDGDFRPLAAAILATHDIVRRN